MGDVWPVPDGGEAASLLGTSPEQRNRSIPSGSRGTEAAGLGFPPYGRRLCGVSLCCVELCCVVLRCVALRCVALRCVAVVLC